MKNLSRYIYGAILGMCLEYLYRVEYNLWPVLISATIVIKMMIDLDPKQRLVNFVLSAFIYVSFFHIWLMNKIKNKYHGNQ